MNTKIDDLQEAIDQAQWVLDDAQNNFDATKDALATHLANPSVWAPEIGAGYFMLGEESILPQINTHMIDNLRISKGNCYQTKALALKAAEYSKVQGLINQACLNVESDYVPDYRDDTFKYWVSYCAQANEWLPDYALTEYFGGAVVLSTEAKAQQVCDILNDIKLKPVGVK